MATENKIFIIVDEDNSKMFPFTETLKCLIPVGNSCTLALLLASLRSLYDGEIIIIGDDMVGLKNITNSYQARWLNKEENYLRQIHSEAEECTAIAVINGEVLLDEKDLKDVIDNMGRGASAMLVKSYDSQTRSIDTVGVHIHEDSNLIDNVYAHPRAHYVNGYYCGASVLSSIGISMLSETDRGYHNINCGQMPDNKYYLEETLQKAIEVGEMITPIYSGGALKIEFPWQIAEVNEGFTERLALMAKDELHEAAIVDDSCIVKGFLRIGKNSIIRDRVIIEGNCWIGENVLIEKGAIIGKNCIINDGSKVQYNCKINDNTVIGTNNKIGFNAEITGVTFDGVCAVHGCEVYSIIGRKVDIAAGVQTAVLRFDDAYTTQNVKGKKYTSPYCSFICIGDYCRTGVNNVFLPGVKVGSRSALGPCLMVDKDIPANSLLLVKQETITKEWGSHKYGW
ncbi:hypothetical protein ACPWSR_04045 [Alloiococcus sp. CFN-8]|uniref:hypothetical protein n=1 Tax=Alloiococcus sp. CFN-8 TaxID=3416081 RepID=UPI003CF35A89